MFAYLRASLSEPALGSGCGTVGKWTKMVQDSPNDHFGQNCLIPNRISALARPKWTKMVHLGPSWPKEVHFGPFRSANRTLAIPEAHVGPVQRASSACYNLYNLQTPHVQHSVNSLQARFCTHSSLLAIVNFSHL